MTRYEVAMKEYNKGTIEIDTLGQIAIGNFSDESIKKAVERKWITKEFAKNMLDVNN